MKSKLKKEKKKREKNEREEKRVAGGGFTGKERKLKGIKCINIISLRG